jgi:hypothetical protein
MKNKNSKNDKIDIHTSQTDVVGQSDRFESSASHIEVLEYQRLCTRTEYGYYLPNSLLAQLLV